MNRTKTPKRPQRRQLPDRLIAPDAKADETQCDIVLAPFDRAYGQMDKKWGHDRLPELVSVETASKWGRTMGRLTEAIHKRDVAEVERIAASAIRGLAVMDAEAEQAGQEPCGLWEYDLDGFRFAILEDSRRILEAKELRPDLPMFTIREAGLALRALHEHGNQFLAEAKKHFPAAEAVNITGPIDTMPAEFFERGGDPVPF